VLGGDWHQYIYQNEKAKKVRRFRGLTQIKKIAGKKVIDRLKKTKFAIKW
jgi:hypothetical protein